MRPGLYHGWCVNTAWRRVVRVAPDAELARRRLPDGGRIEPLERRRLAAGAPPGGGEVLCADHGGQYRDEQRWQRVLTYSASFAIAISCLGLFGLASLAVARRTKEIGIRKALGATVSNIVLLLSKDFVKLILLANLIAWPVAYYAMSKWLQNFAYWIDPGVGIFLLGGVLSSVMVPLLVRAQAEDADGGESFYIRGDHQATLVNLHRQVLTRLLAR